MRRLATIMFTDIVGYSAMMHKDERGTLELLAQHNTIVQAEIERFGGTTIKTIGDAFLIDFNSVVECVECAFAIQEACAQFNTTRAEGRPKLQLRIGIHVGDVVFQENDVFGDGVNVAQRIQSQAEPGSICISEEVFKLIEKKVPIHFQLVGEKKLKNIDRPMRVYVNGAPGMPAQGQAGGSGGRSSSAGAIVLGSFIGLALVGASVAYFYFKPGGNKTVAAVTTPSAVSPSPAAGSPPPPPKKNVVTPPDARIAEHIRKNLFTDLARELSSPEVLSVGVIRSEVAEADPDGKGRFKMNAEVTVEQTQDLFVPHDFQAAVREMGYNPDTYRNALAEAGRISSDLTATAPKEESPSMVKRTTGKGFDVTLPVEFTAALDGSDWTFGPLKKRAGARPVEGFKGQPLSAFPAGSLVVGSEPAMQAVSSYIQARENFAARILVKKTQMQVRQDEEQKSQKEKEEAELRSRFVVGELYDGVMVEADRSNYQVIFMVIENKNEGEMVTTTVALNGEPGVLRSLTGHIEIVQKDGKPSAQAVLTTVGNSGVAPAAGVPEFFHRGKTIPVTFQINGDRIDGSGGAYSFKLSKSAD